MRNRLVYLLCSCLLCLATSLSGQRVLRGIVADLESEPLPFVNILINDSQTRGVSTDIDGKFSLGVTDDIHTLTFSYVGYETRKVAIDASLSFLEVQMKPLAYGIEEVVVVAGENPADIVIRRAVRNRRRNHPDHLDRYQCRTYNKVVFTLTPHEEAFREFIADKDTTRKYFQRYHQNMNRLIETSKKRHLFLMESVTERNFRSPDQTREVVRHNRIAGFREAEFTALANDIQPFSFYDEQLHILDKTFLNPISRGSTRQYFFHLQDSLYQGQDTIFIIQFHPRKGKNFTGLTGVLYIHSNGYAVQNVIAEPADTGFIQLRIEQQYVLVDSRQWFPEQLNFELHVRKYPSPFLGTKVYGKSYVDSVLIDPPVDEKLFKSAEEVVFLEKANASTDSLWRILRREELDSLERNTYEFMDEKGMEWKLDKRLQQLEALSSGRWPLGAIDLSLTHLLAFNEFEGTRLGLGLYTGDRISRIFTLGGYAGYGFQDRAWKYGGSLEIELAEASRTRLRFYHQKDIQEPAAADFSLSRQLVSRRFLARRMDRVEESGLLFSSHPLKYLEMQAGLRRQTIVPFGDYQFISTSQTEAGSEYRFGEAAVGLRYAFRENYVSFLGFRMPESTPFPILEAHYIRGFRGWLNGDFNYHKLLLSIDHQFSGKRVGETSYRLEAGWLSRSAPLAKLFNSSGFGRDFQFLTIGHSFQTMDRYEFLSDRFVHFFFEHNFGTLLLKSGKFQPEFSLVHNLAVGSLSEPGRHRGLDFKTLERGYLEGGLVVENLLRLNYFNVLYLGLGAGAYYRYGHYALPRFGDNWAFRLALSFSY